MTGSEPLWTRDYAFATLVNLCLTVVFYELMTTTALYAVDRFQASAMDAGLAAGIFMIGAVAGRLLSGKYLDFIGRRRSLIIGLVGCVALPILCGWADALGMLVALRALHGAAFGLGSTALSTGALALVPRSRRGEGAGYFGLAPVVASAVGALLGAALVGQIGYPALFASNSAFAAVGLAIALFLRLPERPPTENDRRNARRWNPATLIDVRSAARSGIVFVAAVGLSSVLAFLNSYSTEQGAGEAAGVFFLVYAATALLARLTVGRLQDRLGDRAVVPPLLGCLATGLAILSISPAGTVLIAAAVLVGLGFGALFPVIHASVFTAAPPHRVALATATFYLVGDAGIGWGPPIAGSLLPLLGYQGMYLLLAAAVAVTIVPFLLLGRRDPGN